MLLIICLQVSTEMMQNAQCVSETTRWLAGKPSFSVLTYERYVVNGVKYFTKQRDDAGVVQNSRVSVVAKTILVSSVKDLNPIESEMTYYAIIEEIWELDYYAFKAPVFLCKWATNDRGIKVDELSFTLVDFTRSGHKKDKFISIDQVSQVFYIQDPMDTSWYVVLKSTNRDYNDVYHEDGLGETILDEPPFSSKIPVCDVSDSDVGISNQRPNVEGIWLHK